jgi:hypothetical protein
VTQDTALNDKMFGVWQAGKDFKGKDHSIIEVLHRNFLEGLSKTTKIISQYIQDESAQDFNHTYLQHVYRTLPLLQ